MNVVLIVGAGAVENAWHPVVRAINKTFDVETDVDGANFLLARSICVLKFYAEVASSGKYIEMFAGMKRDISIVKKYISQELKEAQQGGEIKVRSEFKQILDKFVTNDIRNKAWLVSTNWDEVVDDEINKLYQSNNPDNTKVKCFHLHGSFRCPENMYLPSEITGEIYRTKIEKIEIANEHSIVMDMLNHADRVILYGLSLDPLDAELNQTLYSGWLSNNIKEIIVINPEHNKVAKRVKLLLDKEFPVNVIGVCPSNLNEKFEY